MSARVDACRRVLVLRTSRFAGTAIEWATATWPGAAVEVLAPEGAHITLTSVLTSAWGRHALLWRPDAVVVQWWNPAGRGHEAVDRAALLLQPRGFHVVMEDGGHAWVPATRRLARPLRQAGRRLFGVALVAAVMLTTAALWVPTWWRRRRERLRMKGAA